MPRKGEKGKRPGGRPKGVTNKRTIPKAAELLIQAREMRKSPRFKAWVRMCALAAELDAELALAQAVVREARGGVIPRADIEALHKAQDRLMEALRVLLPYERPRLTTTKVQGDKNAPLFNLSGLSDAELRNLRSIVLKAQQVSEIEEDQE